MRPLEGFLKQYLLRTPSDAVNSLLLAANTAADITIPALATCVFLSCDQNFYALTDGNAAAVNTVVTNGSASELNPVGFFLKNPDGSTVTKLSVISESDAHISASFYS